MERMNKMNKDQIAVSLMCMDFLKIKEQLEVLSFFYLNSIFFSNFIINQTLKTVNEYI